MNVNDYKEKVGSVWAYCLGSKNLIKSIISRQHRRYQGEEVATPLA
jgi:hypothetical protein